MSERELVRLVTIDSVEPVPDSDNLDVVGVGGWNVVTQKGLYKPGDEAWYHEIDSLLPLDNPAYEFLAARGVKEVDGKKYHRLKTIKLRGQISQGLLVPFGELNFNDSNLNPCSIVNPDTGTFDDYAGYFGVLKYDDVVVTNAGNADTAGSFPTKYGLKTDSERIQNLKKYWDQIKQEEWVATEKIDGCSLSVFLDDDGIFRICSRNWEIKEGNNLYWDAFRQYRNLFGLLRPGEGFQTEIYGEGIQKNRLGIKGKRIAIFNWLIKGQYVPVANNVPFTFSDYLAPTYNLKLPDTIEEAIAQADGIKSLISPDRLAEGIVWVHENAELLPFLGRHNFKVVSNKYLIKNDG